MNILSINNLSKNGREAPLFTNVTFGMNNGDKAAIIGRNGTGKSTLLSTIAGVLAPDEGTVTINKSAGVSYLGQNPEYNKENTIYQHIYKSKSPKLEKIREYEELCTAMSKGLTSSQQKRFDELTLEMDKGDLWNYESQVRSILSTLGISDMSRKMKSLSGGMIKKVALAQVLVEDTQLLLLDEPTNHLDIQTIWWLQNYLHETKRSVLMITHDRYFLDAVCNNIYELDRKKLKLYQGNYSQYLEKKAIETEPQSAKAYILLGNLYSNKRMFKEAEEQYREALKINKMDPSLFVLIANLYYMNNEIERSIYSYRAAVNLRPENDE